VRFDAASARYVAVPIDLGIEGDQVFLLMFGSGIRYRGALGAITATIGGVAAEVLFAGAQGDFPGLDQINLRVPKTLAGRGEVNIVLTVEGKQANAVTVHFK
jgi:uncharacterized protein (TIGR03437 family)